MSLQRYIGLVQLYRQYIPSLAEKLVPLYKLLQKDVKYECIKDIFTTTTFRQTTGKLVRC